MTRKRWADGGVILVALAAALGLAVTVLVARSDLDRASEATVRGEAEVLVAGLHESAWEDRGPPSGEQLAGQLARFRSAGLRYVALHDPSGVLSAGERTIESRGLAPGTMVIEGERALFVSPLAAMPPPPPLGAPPPGGHPPPPGAPRPPPPGLPPYPPAPFDGADARGVLVIELAPAVLPRLRRAMNRTTFVGGGAVVVLLWCAVLFSVRALRRAEEERRAERDRGLVALGQMSAVMAHELRNPLASLKGNAQLLAEMLGDGSREHTKAELVVREAQRLERLTQDLLSFVRDEALSPRPIPVAKLVDRALEGTPRERVAIDLEGAPPVLSVDEARLAAAIANLVRNAIQSSPAEASVAVRVRLGREGVSIEVQDHGPGIAPGDMQAIFEPFFTRRISGTGLGLAVARRAVEQHGGALYAESPPGGGALFRVVLPRATVVS